MLSEGDERKRRGSRWLTVQIMAAITFSVGIVVLSWLNPGWRPWSARDAADARPATADAGPAAEGPASNSTSPAAMSPERLIALVEEAQALVDAGDPVTGALLALELLRHDLRSEDLAAIHRILY